MVELRNGDVLVEFMKGRDPSRPGRRWEDSIETDAEELGLKGVDWCHVSSDGKVPWPRFEAGF
jgi:hypothetical protein